MGICGVFIPFHSRQAVPIPIPMGPMEIPNIISSLPRILPGELTALTPHIAGFIGGRFAAKRKGA